MHTKKILFDLRQMRPYVTKNMFVWPVDPVQLLQRPEFCHRLITSNYHREIPYVQIIPAVSEDVII